MEPELGLLAASTVESQATEYGDVVSSAPRFTPSSLNCTPTTPTLSLAVAVTFVVPVMLAPAAGAVIDTEGAVVSPVTVALASFDAGLRFAAASSACTL